ncbi:NAD(P)H-quinone oxidoreductase [Devosia faecipullorum]|uniref:NAD(P)H-quinone oxidoreductase n=1 Tax=Devosia faecipullorum TaxID=2755039 RepID=UPI00187B6208|nr:NAD(P)H-quinone oxidoreductase [Devosia faecipullorum]MBE7733126.1 NAD(P)H-quinone oxidoreductase [Devosia faecipullorum]
MTIIPDMLAVDIAAPGGPDMLVPRRLPLPPVGVADILIRVAAAGVNGPDLAQRRGHYDPPPGASPLPGLEVAGEVAGFGAGVSGFVPGQRVMALTNGGGYAEYVAVPAGQVLPMPAGWNFAEAAALPETWFTITQALVLRAGLEPGMVVLIHGGSGGIGGAAIQICAIIGAKPIAVVSDDSKGRYCLSLGAMAYIVRDREDIAARVRELSGGRGADRVVDIIGGAMAAVNVAAAAPGGHIVQISALEGGKAPVPLREIMFKGLTLSGSTLRPQSSAVKAEIAAYIGAHFLAALAAPGWPRPQITSFALEAARAAHEMMESRSHRGKLILLTAFGAGETGT